MTYFRRYLLLVAFAITEVDQVDRGQAPKELSQAQITRIFAIAGAKGYSSEIVIKQCQKLYQTDLKFLSTTQYNELCKKFESAENVGGNVKEGE